MKGKKTGGRKKGTPNKPNPLKEILRVQSAAYYTPRPQTEPDGSPRKLEFRDKEGTVYHTVILQDAGGHPLVVSDYEVDLMMMDPAQRAIIQEKLLRYHTPQMQSVSADVSVSTDISATIEDRLAHLAADNDN